MTYIECLHENIAIVAAIGSARMSGLPGVVLVHITPGAANIIGNLFNAWRSRVPLIILCAHQLAARDNGHAGTDRHFAVAAPIPVTASGGRLPPPVGSTPSMTESRRMSR